MSPRALSKLFETAGSFDQLNVAQLGCFGQGARLWQVILEADSESPTQPDHGAANNVALWNSADARGARIAGRCIGEKATIQGAKLWV